MQAVRGEKHRSLRGAWTPMFFSGDTLQEQGIAGCQRQRWGRTHACCMVSGTKGMSPAA